MVKYEQGAKIGNSKGGENLFFHSLEDLLS